MNVDFKLVKMMSGQIGKTDIKDSKLKNTTHYGRNVGGYVLGVAAVIGLTTMLVTVTSDLFIKEIRAPRRNNNNNFKPRIK